MIGETMLLAGDDERVQACVYGGSKVARVDRRFFGGDPTLCKAGEGDEARSADPDRRATGIDPAHLQIARSAQRIGRVEDDVRAIVLQDVEPVLGERSKEPAAPRIGTCGRVDRCLLYTSDAADE